jgi:ABC-type glycerol-3-phosphate transport system permease component
LAAARSTSFSFASSSARCPEELADAGRIDGCNEFGIYWQIMAPLCKPALATVAVFTFLATWNDYIGPLLYLRSDYNFTVAIGLATFRGVMRTEWNLLMAASTAMTYRSSCSFSLPNATLSTVSSSAD